MVDSLLFVHAATGCDTTSAIYHKDKSVLFMKVQEQPSLRTSVKVFDGPHASRNAGAARQMKRSRVSSMGR